MASWVAHHGAFLIREIPGPDQAPFTEAVFWHPSREADPELRWLCRTLADTIQPDLERLGTTPFSK